MIHEDGKSASELSRKDEIFESPSGLISIAGGKLTGYRKMAERVVNLVVKKHFPERNIKTSHTARLLLADSHFSSNKKIKNYITQVSEALKPYDLSIRTPRYLVENYGQQTDVILKHFMEMDHSEAELSMLKAEALFAIRYEMAASLQDFFVRRTGLLYFEIRKVTIYKSAIALYFQGLLGWNESRLKDELAELDRLISDTTSFKDL